MKKIIFTSLAVISIFSTFGQNYLSGPIGLYGPQYAGVTNIGSGGSIMVSTGGVYTFGGNIVSIDKGNSNSPTDLGRTEIVTFDGTGTYNGASVTAGVVGFVVDGYVKVSNQISSFLLPIGSAIAAYPITVPVGSSVVAAFYDGNGINQNTMVKGNSAATTEYSPFIDMPNGFLAGNYSFSYPSGFNNSSAGSLLNSNNTSASGTSSNTTYSLLSNVANFSNNASTVNATLASASATQIYFATSSMALPIKLASFTGTTYGCTAKLNWQSETEFNSKYYDVEVSVDAINYILESRISSQNNLTGAVYNYTHLLNSPISFVRLKMVDIDGKYSYSKILLLTGTGACSTGAQVLVYPNPANNFINISGLLNGENRIRLFDFAGKSILDLKSNTSYQQIDITKLSKGVYVLRIENLNGYIKSLKVSKL